MICQQRPNNQKLKQYRNCVFRGFLVAGRRRNWGRLRKLLLVKGFIHLIMLIQEYHFLEIRKFQSVKIIPFYHPAVATYNADMKKVLKEDFKILTKLI